MRYRPSRFSPLVAAASAAAAGCGFVGQAFGAYTVTNIVTASSTAPLASTDALGTPTTYTGVSVSTPANHGDGAGYSTFVGTLSGYVTGNSSASVSTPFAYDPVNGFRDIGVYTGTSTGAHTNIAVKDENSAGQVVGYSGTNSAQSSATTNSFLYPGGLLGYTAWLYTTNASTANGTPANYEQTLPGLTGTNFGFTQQYSATGPVASGGAYSGTYSNSQADYVSGNGLVAGTTARYTGNLQPTTNTNIGQSAWLYTPGTGPGTGTIEVGLSDLNHSYNYVSGTTSGTDVFNAPTSVNINGNVAGTSNAVYDKGNGTAAALGTDGFIYYGGQNTAIGLYQYGTAPAGVATGAQYYYTPAGATVAQTAQGAAYYQGRSTSIKGMNATGSVIGTSSYYASTATTASSLGTDAFVYTPTGAGAGGYNQLGLISNSSAVVGTPSFVSATGARSSTPVFINNNTSGIQVAGTSTQYYAYTNSSNTLVTGQGTAAWVQNTTGGMAKQIGLFGQPSDVAVSGTVHVDPRSVVGGSIGVGSSTVTNLTDTGYVAGTAARYRSDYATSFVTLGQDAWVYDPNKNADFIVAPPDETLNGIPGVNANNFVSTTISYLSEDGVAVGSYNDTGNNNPTGNPSGGANFNQAFIWSEANGFVALDGTLSPSLSAAGYQQLISAYFDGGVAGSTIYASASSPAATNAEFGDSYVALTGSVPEPASITSIIGLGAVGLLRRRRSAVK